MWGGKSGDLWLFHHIFDFLQVSDLYFDADLEKVRMECHIVQLLARVGLVQSDYYFWVHPLGIFLRDSIRSVSLSLKGLGHSFCSAALGCQEPE